MTSVDDALDLAVLEVNNIPEDIQPLSLVSTPTNLNLPIRVIGHPFTETGWMVSEGKVISLEPPLLQLSALVAQGNSGSPVLDEQNHVVGVMSFMVPSTEQLIELLPSPDLSSLRGYGVAFSSKAVKEKLESWGIKN